MATLENLEDWLIAIAQHTRQTKEAVEKSVAAKGSQGGEKTWLDTLGRRIEAAVRAGMGMGLVQARALTSRGFGGTVEGARLDYGARSARPAIRGRVQAGHGRLDVCRGANRSAHAAVRRG